MAPRSKLTAQGRISVPAEIRRQLGLSQGSVLEWGKEGERIFLRPVIEEMDDGIRRYMRKKYARR